MQMVPKPVQEKRVSERPRIMAGRIASKREELEHLRERVRFTTLNYLSWCNHANEIAKVYAENDLETFLAANPSLR